MVVQTAWVVYPDLNLCSLKWQRDWSRKVSTCWMTTRYEILQPEECLEESRVKSEAAIIDRLSDSSWVLSSEQIHNISAHIPCAPVLCTPPRCPPPLVKTLLPLLVRRWHSCYPIRELPLWTKNVQMTSASFTWNLEWCGALLEVWKSESLFSPKGVE